MIPAIILNAWHSIFPPRPDTAAELAEVERHIDDDALEAAGQLAIAEALTLWRRDIYDPKRADKSGHANMCRAVISEIVRSDKGAGWSWLPAYEGDDVKGRPEWCGMFAARCWFRSIPLATRKTHFPSCYRLDAWAFAGKDARRGYLQLDADSITADVATFCGTGPRAGDILIVGDRRPVWGDHIALVERYDAADRMFYTVEGNGVGLGPRGNRRQGIVRAKRPLGARQGHTYIGRRLIRPAVADLGG